MDVQEYLVTLGIRPAELSGLKELPGTTKDRLTPLVLLAPWLATSPLSRALDKFEESYSSRPYFIDVDTYYQVNDKPNEAKELWAKLAAKPADLDAWWGLLFEYPNANPCLLMAERTIESAREQIVWAREQDRTFCLRMNLAEGIGSGIPQWMPALVSELAAEGTPDASNTRDHRRIISCGQAVLCRPFLRGNGQGRRSSRLGRRQQSAFDFLPIHADAPQ